MGYYIDILLFVLIAYGGYKSYKVTSNKGFTLLTTAFIFLAIKTLIEVYTFSSRPQGLVAVFELESNLYIDMGLPLIELVSYMLIVISVFFLSNPKLYKFSTNIDKEDILD